jgi:hypothetical protein
MKKTISILLTSLCILGCSTAQPIKGVPEDKKFITIMETNLKKLDTASIAGTFIMLANTFERIGNAEKKYWQPWYYAALCYGFMAMNTPDKTLIDPLTAKAEEYIAKAILLSNNNSEISALQGMITNTKILADPITRWQTYSAEAAAFLKNAKDQNPVNPRPYLIEARTKLYTPAAMGGGPEAARPMVEKAMSNFAAFKPENTIAPGWGLAQTQKLQAKINGK